VSCTRILHLDDVSHAEILALKDLLDSVAEHADGLGLDVAIGLRMLASTSLRLRGGT
jgi:hypothetical protein